MALARVPKQPQELVGGAKPGGLGPKGESHNRGLRLLQEESYRKVFRPKWRDTPASFLDVRFGCQWSARLVWPSLSHVVYRPRAQNLEPQPHNGQKRG